MRFLALALVCIAAGGCSVGHARSPAAASSSPTAAAVVHLATYPPRQGGLLAGLGTGSIVEREVNGLRCVVLRRENGAVRNIVFPEGYMATAEPLQVHDGAGRVVLREGVVAAFSGGRMGYAEGTPCLMPSDREAYYVNSLSPR